jgi:hypothetical protein
MGTLSLGSQATTSSSGVPDRINELIRSPSALTKMWKQILRNSLVRMLRHSLLQPTILVYALRS